MKVFFIHKTPSIFKSKVDIHFFFGGGGDYSSVPLIHLNIKPNSFIQNILRS